MSEQAASEGGATSIDLSIPLGESQAGPRQRELERVAQEALLYQDNSIQSMPLRQYLDTQVVPTLYVLLFICNANGKRIKLEVVLILFLLPYVSNKLS